MSVAIQADNVSKKYRLLHENRERYATIRDSLTNGIGNFLRKLASPGPLFPHSRRPAEEDFLALNNVSFTIEQGERVGIVGRNGAGKTTLLKILSRITEPTTGTIRIRGRAASLLEVGTGFHPELTGSENIYLNGAILGMSKAEIGRKYDEIVAFAEVERFLDTPVKRYSSGMYVRLAFAVAAHLQPEILLVDEVLAVGDAQFQKKCLGKMKEVGHEGRTVLFVSHNLSAIRTLCDRALLLRDGMLVADGSASDVVAQYSGDLKESVHVREWRDAANSPRNSSAILRKVSVLGEDGYPIGDILTDAGFLIEIEYEVLMEGSSVGWAIIFYDSENNCVFSSISNHEKNWYGKPMPRGRFRSCCRIPANLLNDRWLTLGLNMFGKGFSDARSLNDVLRIEVLDGPRVRADFFGRFDGVFRPLLEWETSRIPEDRRE